MAKVVKFNINWEKSSVSCLHYSALVKSEDLSVVYLAAIYESFRHELFIYDCEEYKNTIPGTIAQDIVRRAQLKQLHMHKIIGNENFFGGDGKRTTERLMKEAFRKLKVEQNIGMPVFYEMGSAAAFIGQMFLEKRIYVHTRCMNPAQHFASWTIDPVRGRALEDKPYAIALCHIGSELKQGIHTIPEKYTGHDYYRSEKKEEKTASWLTI